MSRDRGRDPSMAPGAGVQRPGLGQRVAGFCCPQMWFCQDAVNVMTGWRALLLGKSACGADGSADYQGFPLNKADQL